MISRFFDTEFDVLRQSRSGGKSEFAEHGTVTGHLQQVDQEWAVRFAQGKSLTHRAWCAIGEDIVVGDALETGGSRYVVRGVQRNVVGSNKHLDLLLEKQP